MSENEHEPGADWTRRLQLEAELLIDECDFGTLRNICKGHVLPDALRKRAWIILLGANKQLDSLNWDDIYDLSNQLDIRDLAIKIIDQINPNDEQKVTLVSNLESVLTYYIKTNQDKTINPSWNDILSILMSLNLERNVLYKCFSTIVNKYVIRNENYTTELPYDLFRLILLYHEPELCSFLESKKIPPKQYCFKWFSSLLSSSMCKPDVIKSLWDVYFQHADQFLVIFICLVFVVNAKETLMNMKECDKEIILEYILKIPSSLTVEDVEDICTIAQHYAALTPYTTRSEFRYVLFKQQPYVRTQPVAADEETASPSVNLSHALCLSVSVEELLRSKSTKDSVISYFVVDCRPPEQYNNGHHPTAFHLDANLMLQDPGKFETAVSALLAAQKNALSINSLSGGKHLCLVGSGRMTEDQYLLMIAANFLRKHHKHVSLLKDGYAGLHNALHDNLDKGLSQHNPKHCIMCVSADEHNHSTNGTPGIRDGGNKTTSNFLGKFSNVMKAKTQEMKEKLTTYITNPSGNLNHDSMESRHVSPKDLSAKRYRNMPAIFSVADDYDASSDEAPSGGEEGRGEVRTSSNVLGGIQECVSVDGWCTKVGAIGRFPCNHFVNGAANLSFPSHVIVTRTHLYILRHLRHNSAATAPTKATTNRPVIAGDSVKESSATLLAYVACTQPLNAIVKITSRKRNPEIITLKYGRVLLPNDNSDMGGVSNKSTPEPNSTLNDGEDANAATIQVDSWDKLHIPEAGDATKLIKRLIVEQLEREEEEADSKVQGLPSSSTPTVDPLDMEIGPIVQNGPEAKEV